MKKIHLLGFAVVALAFASCGETKKEPVTDPNPQIETTDQNAVTPTEPVAVETTNANGSEALNPAHGQPGHRCDIAVGAPLSTPAGGQAATPSQPATPAAGNGQPFLVNDQAKQNAGSTAATPASGTLNPAHGQPGHRCDIQVGQPLP